MYIYIYIYIYVCIPVVPSAAAVLASPFVSSVIASCVIPFVFALPVVRPVFSSSIVLPNPVSLVVSLVFAWADFSLIIPPVLSMPTVIFFAILTHPAQPPVLSTSTIHLASFIAPSVSLPPSVHLQLPMTVLSRPHLPAVLQISFPSPVLS
eukprot:1371201-Amorphochlora_amoeboformis.AAC.1